MSILINILKKFGRSVSVKRKVSDFLRVKIYKEMQETFSKKFKLFNEDSSGFKPKVSTKDFVIYFHFPFCKAACKFCTFNKSINSGQIGKYCESIIKEIKLWGNRYPLNENKVTSVYFGGGTPSLIPANYLTSIIKTMRYNFPLDDKSEITIESSPDSITEVFLDSCLENKVKRISIGGQSFQENVLKEMKRIHTPEELVNVIKLVQKKGIDFNVDILFGWDCQDKELFLKDLEKAVDLNIKHISLYNLSPPPVKGKYFKSSELIEKQKIMYYAGREFLLKEGYKQYTFEDFTKSHECLYTRSICTFPTPDLLPLGLGSYGWVGNYGLVRHSKLDDYISLLEKEKLPLYYFKSALDYRIINRLFLSLRLLSFDLKNFYKDKEVIRSAKFRQVLELFKYLDFITIDNEIVKVKDSAYFTLSEMTSDLVFYAVL